MKKALSFFACTAILLTSAAFAQMDGKGAKPSPAESASCDLGGGKNIKTDYSSPRMKGRKIYGGLVPYGEVWRTGANEATTFVTNTNLTIGDTKVAPGAYTIFTVPNADHWQLIINKKTGEWGIPYKYESEELGRVDMKVSKLSSPMEDFTINYEKNSAGCMLNLDWENTRASVEIKPFIATK